MQQLKLFMLVFIILPFGSSLIFAQPIFPIEIFKEFDNPSFNKAPVEYSFVKNYSNYVDSISVIDSIFVYRSDYDKRRVVFSYDDLGNMTLCLTQKWNNGKWQDYQEIQYIYDVDKRLVQVVDKIGEEQGRRNSYMYDSNNNIISSLSEFYENNIWEKYKRKTYIYSSNNNLTSLVYEHGSSLSIRLRNTYSYDPNGNLTKKLSELRNRSGFENNYVYTYVYDRNNNLISRVKKAWIGTQWENSRLYTYTYNSIGSIISYQQQGWNGSSWENKRRYSYTYDSNNNVVLKLYERWIGKKWKWDKQNIYTYDSNANMTLYLRQNWDGEQWIGIKRETCSYDSGVVLLAERWNGAEWEASTTSIRFRDFFGKDYHFFGLKVEIYKSLLSNKNITNVEENNSIIRKFHLFQNYPNPFNPTTEINYSLPQSGLVQLRVYDVLGREIAVLLNKEQQKGNHNAVFNATNLPSGIYFYTLTSGNYRETKKMLLLR